MRFDPLARLLPAGLAALALASGCGGQKVDTSATRPASPVGCGDCHGSAGAGTSAPPRTSYGATASTDRGVGAHDAHVKPSALHRAMACAECHPTPETVTAPGHNDGTVDVVFGGLARAGDRTGPPAIPDPTWNKTSTATSPALSCSATYCHGGTLHDGTNRQPVWTQVDGTQAACGTCHAIPPTWAGHPDVTALAGYDPLAPRKSCNQCHPSTVLPSGDIDVAGGAHIDGILQIGAKACTQCHGDATRLPLELAPAPPTPPATADPHLAHLTGRTLAPTPVACGECHAPRTSMLNHPSGQVAMAWGPLASAGGAVPTLVRGGAAPSCATTYCHGGTLAGGTRTAPTWDATAGQAACGTCHGLPPTQAPSGPHPNLADALAARTPPVVFHPGTDNPRNFCHHCHPGTVDAAGELLKDAQGNVAGQHLNGYVDLDDGAGGVRSCTSCHGDPGKPVVVHAAPPRSVGGASDTADRGVGAHMAHLVAGTVSAPLACNQCHPPITTTNHAATGAAVNGHQVDFAFGPLATNLGLSYPTWNGGPRYDASGNRLGCAPNGGDCSCSAVYCHGDGLQGGTVPKPIWNKVDGTQAACGACHGIPPPAPHVTRLDCGTCHAGYTSSTVNLVTHVNGVIEATALACTVCHGDANRTPATAAAAPPFDTLGGTATTARGVGAHQRHLVDGLLRRAMPCSECHLVPTAMDHANGVVDVAFGPLARDSGAAAVWNPTTLTCSSVYCHGATLGGGSAKNPVWTRVDGTYTACGTCHGVPPPTTAPTSHPASNGSDCGSCHTGYTGTTVNLALHIDGKIDATGGSCSSCHGDSTRVAVTGADPQFQAAPPKDHLGNTAATARGVGAHFGHVNKGPGALAAPIACSECHVVPASVSSPGHNNGTTEIVFGPRAKTRTAATATTPAAGTVTPAPTYGAGALTCSATYCHGNYSSPTHPSGRTAATPAWTATAGLSCTDCHQVPTDSCHPPRFNHDGGNTCNSCHKHVNAAGTAITNPTLHVNGVVDGKCTDCHTGAAAGSRTNITCLP